MTAVAVLHDPNQAAQYADRIILMSSGTLIAEGRPEDVLTAERISKVFNVDVTLMKHPKTGRLIVVP